MCGKPIEKVYRSPYFCDPCDRKRIDHISEQFEKISKLFESKGRSDSNE